jgi:transcriptional regulator with XRE-family HTH domain
MTDIHKKIAAVRRLRCLTQAQVCARAFCSLRTYQRIEAGKKKPTVEQLECIAQAFCCTFDELWHFDLGADRLSLGTISPTAQT